MSVQTLVWSSVSKRLPADDSSRAVVGYEFISRVKVFRMLPEFHVENQPQNAELGK